MNNNNTSANDQTTGNVVNVSEPASVTCIDEGVTSFFDAEPGFTTTIASQPDPTYQVGSTAVTDIQKWLSRPAEIARYSHGIAGNPIFTLNPWELFFNLAPVKRKLENFALLRCKLNIKVVVNASPIWWGTSVLSYKPLVDMLVSDASDGTSQVASMRPHIYINPTTSQGGCLCLPFFFNENWLDISDNSDFVSMGRLYFKYLNDVGLRCSVTPNTQNVEYTIFAWASDVELSQTTSGLALQAGNEYATGPISSIASSVANVAGKLKTISYLAPYAKATEIAATAIGKVAHIFGFSRSPVLDNPRYVKNQPFGTLANCGTHETVDRLCVDPKNELCVDSRTVGLDGSDEMTISSIAMREMYLGFAEWHESDAANKLLYYSLATPSIVHTISTTAHLPSPLSFASRPFKYWRGDLIIRVVVAASGYHRGRLLIQWDPQAALTNTVQVNEVASKILDLSVTRDVEFIIPYAAHTAWLNTGLVDSVAPHYTFRKGVTNPMILVPNLDETNGSITIRVLNPATGITSTNEILDVQIFMRAADNFSVACPRNLPDGFSMVADGYQLQSSDAPDISLTQDGDFSPVGTGADTMIATTDVQSDAMAMICMGEEVVSFRTLLKRYNFAGTKIWDIATDGSDNGTCAVYSSISSRWPLPRGRMIDGIDNFVSGPGNIVKNTLFSYLQGAFVGMRGSSRWKFNAMADNPLTEISVARTDEELNVAKYSQRFNVGYRTTFSRDECKARFLPDFVSSGYSLTNPGTQSGVEIDSPQYSRYRFIPASPYSIPLGMESQDTNVDGIEFRMLSPYNQNYDRTAVSMHHAVGDDFSFFFFLQTPIIYNAELTAAPLP